MVPMIDIPNYPLPEKQDVPVKQDPVARSIAKPDAFAKPATIGKGSVTRVRLTNEKPKGRPRKRKRDKRDVKFF